jgi:putative hydroxymethylpyrimidine transport system ATP-binding protein
MTCGDNMKTPKIVLKNVAKTYVQENRALEVLADVSLEVCPGEFVSIIGPSGCGKSTLFKLITGVDGPDSGEIIIDGQKVGKKIRRIGYMPQRDQLMPWKTLLENAMLPLEIQGVNRTQAEARVQELLPVFGLEGFANAYPTQLSGGMRQRGALLRTILIESDLVLLDEPFGALDAITREKMQRWLLGVWEKLERTVLFITHSVDEAVLLSDRVYVMSPRPGRIIAEEAIKLPRPREWDMITSAGFVRHKEALLKSLI